LSDSSTNSSTNFNTNTNTSNNSNASQSKTLTPYQSAIQAPLFNYVQNLMTPQGAQAAVAPYTAAAMDSTNSAYSGLANTLRSQFLSTGNGQSGKYGSALVQGNLQRLGALQGVQTTGEEEAAALPMQASTLAASLLGQNFGSTSTAASTGTSATTGSSNTKSSTSGSSFSLGL
jgi:hypothetical protein